MGVPGFFAWILKNYKKSNMITNVIKNEELKDLVSALKTKFWKQKVVVPIQEEL
jgi:hypothetical protein